MQSEARFVPARRAAAAAALTALAAVFVPPLAAQLPKHHAAVGTMHFPNPNIPAPPGNTGVYFVPLPTSSNPGAQTPIPVTGLPAALVQPPGGIGGAFSILHRPADGRLFVGDSGAAGTTLNVHVLTLTGANVTSATAVPIGTIAPNRIEVVNGFALFPDGRVLVASNRPGVFVPGSGPAADSALNILDTSTPVPTWTSVPLTPVLGGVSGVAIHPSGKTAYMTTFVSNGGNPPCYLYEVNVDTTHAGFGQATLRYTWGDRQALSMDLHDGVLYASAYAPATSDSLLFAIDTNDGFRATAHPVSPANVALYGPGLDPASGLFVHASLADTTVGGQFPNQLVTSSKAGGGLSLLATAPPGGWALPYAIEINRSTDSYGVGTDGANRYAFVDCPNPGGLPQLGNNGFSLTVEAQPGNEPPTVSFVAVSETRASIPLLGVEVLVGLGPTTLAFGIALAAPPANQATVPIPIPTDPTLAGLRLHAQSLHFEMQPTPQFAASAGFEFTVF